MKRLLLLIVTAVAAGASYAQTPDTSQAVLDSIDAKFKLLKLKEISVSAPRPVYSMTGEVVNYNVENDPTVAGLTAFDAIRNAPTVNVDEEGNITMRGSEQVEVWLNGHPTHMNGPVLRTFFESMPADAVERIEVIKNPGAQYMVSEGSHILNIVTSTRMRASELWVFGLSGNSRPYLSPWLSYVRNTDRLQFNINVSGSHSHQKNCGNGDITLLDGDDTNSYREYSSSTSSNNVFGMLIWGVEYKIDSSSDFSIDSWSMLQGNYARRAGRSVEQWDESPSPAHYRYLDTSDGSMLMLNGFTNFEYKHRFARKGQSMRVGATWNYLFSGDDMLDRRIIMMSEGVPSALVLAPYDRSNDMHRRNNTLMLSLRYNHPLGEHDELSVGIGGQPYGNTHFDRTLLDGSVGGYSEMDSLYSYVSDYHSRNVYTGLSLRHEWGRTTITVELYGRYVWLGIANAGLFPDDTTFRYLNIEPSMSLTHRTESMHYFRYRYAFSRTNPTGSDLTTSRFYNSDSYSTGVRTLKSSVTHRNTLSWNKYHDKLGNMGVDAYASYTAGGIESVTLSTTQTDPYLGRIVSYTVPMNVADSYKCGLDANLTYRPTAWFSLRLDGSLYREGYRAYGDETPEWAVESFRQRSRTSWNLSAGLWTKVAKLVNVNFNVNYGSPTLALFVERESALTASLGLSATLLDGRLSVRVNASDLFDSNRSQSAVSTPGYASFSSSHSSLRYITFGISYRLGKLDLEWQARGGAANQ